MRNKLVAPTLLILFAGSIACTRAADGGPPSFGFTNKDSDDSVLHSISPDKQLEFTTEGQFGQVVEIESHKPVGSRLAAWEHFKFSCWSFSPDGKYLATGTRDARNGDWDNVGLIQVWDVATGKQLTGYGGYDHKVGRVKSVAFSKDGSKIIYRAERFEIDGP